MLEPGALSMSMLWDDDDVFTPRLPMFMGLTASVADLRLGMGIP